MKIDYKKENIDNFISNFEKLDKFKAIFIYGADESVVSSRVRKLKETFVNNRFSINNIDQLNIKENPTLLSEQFYSVSLFGDRSVLLINLIEKENDYFKYIEPIFKENVAGSSNFLIITAGDLTKTSKLVKFTEDNEYIASIICYEEFDSNIKAFINGELRKYGFIYNSSIVDFLLDNISGNKLIIENEIKKIDLYKGDNKNLSLEDVKKCVADLSESDLSDLINSFCDFNEKEFFRLLNKFFKEKNQFIVLCRSLINYFLQLQRIQYCITVNQEPVENLVKRERIFWKQVEPLKQHLKQWSLKKINQCLLKFIDLEKLKFSSSQTEIEDFFLRAMLVFGK